VRTPTADGARSAEGADPFAGERPRLLGLAYRMLGSLADAEDVVQDAWLRWAGADQAKILNPAAWLTTTTTRLALDRMRTLSRRREDYVGPWLPEPVSLAADTTASADPQAATELAESMTLGFLVVLDTLSATERAVFLLADVFGEPYAAIAAAVGKTEDNCRQIASRARRKVRAARKPETAAASAELLAELLTATASGDIDGLLALLDTDVVLLSDGGPDRRAARRPVVGPEKVARFMVNLARRLASFSVEVGSLNGEVVVIFHLPDGPMVLGGDVVDGRFVGLQWQRNPDKLTHLDEAVSLR
jgi:RNA polymerase sigma-70 factor (ECF subfamily)